ncbi:plant UBX domain-containing protein 10-like [Diospyros lotus]|uniref:plant UBX domain-containing protein 10-like n=1 Tax=Diospyros lotus TaxID=55363 RepID=UPI00225761FF|nr:plant UBX domain-containing protein 10-like [Diospyros lotus]
MMRRGAGARGDPMHNAIVRRIVSIPRNLLGGFSRAVSHGIDLMGIGGRRSHYLPQPSFPPQYPPEPSIVQDEWAFLNCFEQQYGGSHPFFYACRFTEALKMAQEEHKFVFLYLHSPEHPFTPLFCRETLCSELVVQFLDTNFVCWAALANGGEGLQMTATLQPASYPFCAVLAPASGDNLAVLQQIEGPVSPAELVEILQRTLDEQGLAFGSGRAREEERTRVDRRLRQEQDAAYLSALQADQERDRLKSLASDRRAQKQAETSSKANTQKHWQNPIPKQASQVKETTSKKEAQPKDPATTTANGAQLTQIQIRFPNGERREQSFKSTDKIQAIYRHIDSLGMPGVANYRLISSFPRRVYGVDQMGMTLREAGLHPKASLFLELM